MKVTRLATSGFRNLVPAVVDVDAPLVVWWGANGQGKTNLLEAVGVLGSLRSFRTPKVAEVVQVGKERAEIQAVAESEGIVRRYQWSHGVEGRALRREDRTVEALPWLQSLRATWFAPEDVSLIRGEPALRRALLDRTVLTVDPDHLTASRDFKRVLDHKAALLRAGGGTDAQLDVLDAQLARLGHEVSGRRAAVVERLRAAWGPLYRAIAGEEASGVRLRSWLGDGTVDTYVRRLGESRAAEREARRNLGGPQRDDLEFSVGQLPARSAASQGQARSLVLAWKLAELEVARARHGEAPLFLMDDVGSELDPARTRALMELVRSLGAQVFVTTTDPRHVPEGVAEARRYEVRGGAVAGAVGTG